MPSTDAQPSGGEPCAHLAERCMDHREVGTVGREALPAGHGVRVAIDTDDPAARSVEHGPTVAAATERGIDVDAAVPKLQGLQSLVEKDGSMSHPCFSTTKLSTGQTAVPTTVEG